MRRLLALMGMMALVAGTPAGIIAVDGPPRIPQFDLVDIKATLTSGTLAPETVVHGLMLLAWVLWAYLVFVIVLRAAAMTVLRPSFRLSSVLVALTDRAGPSVVLKLVDAAVGTAMLLTPIAAAWALASPPAVAVAAGQTPETSPGRSAGLSNGVGPAEAKSYVVRPGDSLWKIGKRELGSGYRWPEIFQANQGRLFPDGRVLNDPRLIRPNWVLWLPHETAEAGTPQPQQAPAPRVPTRMQPPQPTPEPQASPIQESQPAPKALKEDGYQPGTRTEASSSHAPSTSRDPKVENAVQSKARFDPSLTEPTPESPSTTVPKTHKDKKTPVSKAPFVTLPSGTAMAASFASGVLASHALATLRRRRTYRPSLESASAAVVEPEPEIVEELKKAQAAPNTSLLKAAVAEVASAWKDNTGSLPAILWATEYADRIEVLIDEDVEAPSGGQPDIEWSNKQNCVQAVVRKSSLSLAERFSPMEEGLLVPLGLEEPSAAVYCGLQAGPLALSGPAMKDWVLQGLLAAAADHTSRDLEMVFIGDPDPFAQVLELPHARLTDWQEATQEMGRLNQEMASRGRMLSRTKSPDMASFLASQPDEFVPTILIACTKPPEELKAQLEGIAAQASRLSCAFLALGWRPRSSRISLKLSDTIEVHSKLPLSQTSLQPFMLNEALAAQVKEVLIAAGQNNDDADTAPSAPEVAPAQRLERFEQKHEAEPVQQDEIEVLAESADSDGKHSVNGNGQSRYEIQSEMRHVAFPASGHMEQAVTDSGASSGEGSKIILNGRQSKEGHPGNGHGDYRIESQVPTSGSPSSENDFERAGVDPEAEVSVTCFGPMVVSRDGEEIGKYWEARSKELLAYLVAHPDGVSKDRLIEALWPNVSSKKGDYHVRQAIYQLRRRVAGQDDLKWSEKYVLRTGETIKIDRKCWEVDLWRFDWLLTEAEALPPPEAQNAYRKALGLYKDDLCDDSYFSWLEPTRERFRRQFLAASSRFAELLEQDQKIDEAVDVLDRAIEVDPLCEELYRKAIRLEASNGRSNSARVRYRKLVTALSEELGEEPDVTTKALMKSLPSRSAEPAHF